MGSDDGTERLSELLINAMGGGGYPSGEELSELLKRYGKTPASTVLTKDLEAAVLAIGRKTGEHTSDTIARAVGLLRSVVNHIESGGVVEFNRAEWVKPKRLSVPLKGKG